MISGEKIKGFAIICDSKGLIMEVLKDEMGFHGHVTAGAMFFNFLDPDSRFKFLDFIIEIKSKRIAFGQKMNLRIGPEVYNLIFIGILIDQNLLIITSNNESDALLFLNEIQQINNEQANEIRFLMKGLAGKNRDTGEDDNMLRDITRLNNELVNLQRELSKKNTELLRLDELKNRFLGMAVHDLRNPLNIINSYCELLKEELGNSISEKHQEFLGNILHSSEYMLNLVNELIDIAKIDSGKMELNLREARVFPVILQSIQMNNVVAGKKNIKIQLEASDQQLRINADIQRIVQVLHNLISNAIKFSFPNSEIVVGLRRENDAALVSVTDFGVGIKPAFMPRLFIPFDNGGARGTQGEKGTGLGLAIVKRIVEAHGGKIWAESEPGKGSVFFVQFPLINE